MKYKKQQFIGRIVSYILSFCMTFIMIPMTVHAQILGKDAIPIEATCIDGVMQVYFNDEKVGNESTTISGEGIGYTQKGSNKVKIILSLDIGSIKVNHQEITLPKGTTKQAEFKVKAASNYSIVVTKKQETFNILKTRDYKQINTNIQNNKASKIKTGNQNNDLIFMGIIGLSILGIYCIIMKNYIH